MARGAIFSHSRARCLARQLRARFQLPDSCEWLPAIGYAAWTDSETALARWVQSQAQELELPQDEAFEPLSERLRRCLTDWFDG